MRLFGFERPPAMTIFGLLSFRRTFQPSQPILCFGRMFLLKCALCNFRGCRRWVAGPGCGGSGPAPRLLHRADAPAIVGDPLTSHLQLSHKPLLLAIRNSSKHGRSSYSKSCVYSQSQSGPHRPCRDRGVGHCMVNIPNYALDTNILEF